MNKLTTKQKERIYWNVKKGVLDGSLNVVPVILDDFPQSYDRLVYAVIKEVENEQTR